jgi:hypothetical protein
MLSEPDREGDNVVEAWTSHTRDNTQWLPFVKNLRVAAQAYAVANDVSEADAAEMVVTPIQQQSPGQPASIAFAMNTGTKTNRQFFDMFCCKLLDQTLSVTSEESASGRRGQVILHGSSQCGMGLQDLLNILQAASVVTVPIDYPPALVTQERWGLGPSVCGTLRAK